MRLPTAAGLLISPGTAGKRGAFHDWQDGVRKAGGISGGGGRQNTINTKER